jgi:hypothetical protein
LTRYRVPEPGSTSFARTNLQTIQQRAALLREIFPGVKTIAEICCGDCSRQNTIYGKTLRIERYAGLDIQPEIVALNRARGIECDCGDALDAAALLKFVDFDVLFFGPPLSEDCDGHHLLRFPEVIPGYAHFARLLLGELGYRGMLVCIGPRDTTLGDIQWFYRQIQDLHRGFGLRLIHKSYSTLTGNGEETEPRLKYVELWFSSRLEEAWEIRESSA